MANTVVLSGPQGCGKTRHAAELMRLLGCDRVIDEWWPGQPLVPGALHLTHAQFSEWHPETQDPCGALGDTSSRHEVSALVGESLQQHRPPAQSLAAAYAQWCCQHVPGQAHRYEAHAHSAGQAPAASSRSAP